jgi:predicted metal-dependent hydrolase
MPSKIFALDEELSVTVHKRRTSRNLRLSIAPTGEVRVSIPAWAPYKTGVDFARSREAWIRSQIKPPNLLRDGQAIGKAHHVSLFASQHAKKISSRVLASSITVRYPEHLTAADSEVQRVAREACVRALRSQAEQLLPQRLATLAAQHDFGYNGVSIKRLKGRWGSCDQDRHIVLNLYLMQLPWELIDYVLLHELTHTKILRHGPDFWRVMNQLAPNTKIARAAIKQYNPVLSGD